MNKIRLILSFSTALAVLPLYAQQTLDNGMNERRLKLPTYLDDVTKKREEEAPTPVKAPEGGLKTRIAPVIQPRIKPPEALSQRVTDERGLRQTLSSQPLSTRKAAPAQDDSAMRARFQAEKEQQARGASGAKKDAEKVKTFGPLLEVQPRHPMAVISNAKTGAVPPKKDPLKKKMADSLSNLDQKPKNYVSQKRLIAASEADLYKKNSPLRPFSRVIPAKPYETPLDLTYKGRVANPLARGAVIDPISGGVIPQLKIIREVSPTGLTILGKDQSVLSPFILDNDAFVTQGVRSGGFILRPTLEMSAGFDDNPGRAAAAKPAAYITTKLGMSATSDFSRHLLTADINASASAFTNTIKSNRPEVSANFGGRLDIFHDQSLNFDAKYKLTSQTDETSTMIGEPLIHTFGVGAAYNIDFNRLIFSLRSSVERAVYDTAHLSDGTSLYGTDRTYNTGRVALRGIYKHSEEVRPFVEVFTERRAYDAPDSGLTLRGSDAYGGKVGVRFDKNARLKGEIAVGYMLRQNREPTLADLRGLIFDAGLIWAASGLTNVTLRGGTSFDETAITGVSTQYKRDLSLQIDHAFRRYLIGSARIGVGYDTYEGTSQVNNRVSGSLGLAYKFTRDLSVAGEIRHTKFNSNTTGNYNSTLVMMGVKLAR